MGALEIKYSKKSLMQECTNYDTAKRKYGRNMATSLHKRIDQISASSSIDDLLKSKIGRFHPLRGKREGYYAMDLEHPFRLILKPEENVTEIIIVSSIEDYH